MDMVYIYNVYTFIYIYIHIADYGGRFIDI